MFLYFHLLWNPLFKIVAQQGEISDTFSSMKGLLTIKSRNVKSYFYIVRILVRAAGHIPLSSNPASPERMISTALQS